MGTRWTRRLDCLWHVMILLRKRSEKQGLLAERFVRGRGIGSGSRFFVFRLCAVGISVLFRVGEFEHEGLESRSCGFSDNLFGGGFKVVL